MRFCNYWVSIQPGLLWLGELPHINCSSGLHGQSAAVFALCTERKNRAETKTERRIYGPNTEASFRAKQTIPQTNWTTSMGVVVGHVVGFVSDTNLLFIY